jgi:uncharacterized protein (TIGR03083 family)
MSIAEQDGSQAQWDATNFAAKDNLLRIVREEAEGLFALAEKPENWEAPTPAGHWRVKNIVAHIADTTEGYLERIETTRGGATPEALAPLTEMASTADKRAQALSNIPQDEMVARLRDDFGRAMKMFEEVDEHDWGNLLITHAYMGPVPAFFYPIGQLMDYGVHSWDLREGLEMPHFMGADASDMLVPFMFVLWQATTDVSRLGGETLEVGVRVSGRNAGTYRVTVTSEGMVYEPGSGNDLPVLIDFDPASLVLTAFGRVSSGTPYGDLDAARKFAGLFFRI